MKIWPIYIPSKGRPHKLKTLEQLIAHPDLEVTMVVEEQDLPSYVAAAREQFPERQPKFDVLPVSGQGIAYVRNFILQNALGDPWYWMMDDDVSGFYLVRGGKTVRTPAPLVLAEAQACILGRSELVAQAAMEYQQFAWSQKKPAHMHGYCDVVVAINQKLAKGVRYRKELDLKEDRDFTLQLLARGYSTMRSTWTAFSAPKNGSNEGGLKDLYDTVGREAEASKRMCEAWPGICTPNPKPDGRPDVKINWSLFKVKK